jgi:tetratricopeptide (TPR) repeat protein
MTVKDNCDKWIEYAYENWLNNWVRTLEGNKYLSEAAENMVKRMKDASRNGKTEEAWHLMERLQRMSGTFYGTSENHDLNYHDQWAEIYMECALVAYDLGDLAEASKLLHEATGNFYGNQTLQKAIVYWFLGCIQWQLPAHSEEAVVSWERAMKIVKGAAADIDKEQKCKQVADVMREAINAATLEGSPNSPRNSSEENTANTEAPHRPTRSSANSSSLRLGFLPYYGSIPAGDPVAALKSTSEITSW